MPGFASGTLPLKQRLPARNCIGCVAIQVAWNKRYTSRTFSTGQTGGRHLRSSPCVQHQNSIPQHAPGLAAPTGRRAVRPGAAATVGAAGACSGDGPAGLLAGDVDGGGQAAGLCALCSYCIAVPTRSPGPGPARRRWPGGLCKLIAQP